MNIAKRLASMAYVYLCYEKRERERKKNTYQPLPDPRNLAQNPLKCQLFGASSADSRHLAQILRKPREPTSIITVCVSIKRIRRGFSPTSTQAKALLLLFPISQLSQT
ncbi:hypothetical protein KFK09_004733 [Dendrobium nobile]|uniref:Uncharacterized protein n=1 Tax=Dendrobium nobile TaxID=94219 RepID=A0A8T3BTS8_DENNO|nr:hypothetical protein KFK09_004733 [Dendrobium nobile]